MSESAARNDGQQPIGIFYEHPEWFKPLFSTLERRGLPYRQIAAESHYYDPSDSAAPYALVVNRVSASSYLRGHTNAIFHAREYLHHLETIGIPVVNGTRAFALDTSKARQLTLLARLGLPYPRSLVANQPDQIVEAAGQLRFPIIVKPNIGGSGALMRRFDRNEELRQAVADGTLESILGLDLTAIVQEYHPPKGGAVVRIEALDDRFLYAIRIYNDPSQGFNICPADICQAPAEAASSAGEASPEFDLCPIDAPAQRSMKIESAEPPAWVVEGVLRIFREASVDLGGVEYLESERDGQLYLYDINSLSNFVTGAVELVGFDPFERFVDYIERRAGWRSLAGIAG